LFSAACVTTRAVEPHRLRRDDRVVVVAERPQMLRGSLAADRSLRYDCPLRRVEGRILFVAGDSIWIDPIATRTLADGAPGECGSVDAGVIMLADSSGVAVTRAEMNGAATAVGFMALLVVLAELAFSDDNWLGRP
jgi:hypothetical protein